MTAPYSMDLRERALARKEAGETNREIASLRDRDHSSLKPYSGRPRSPP